MSDGLIGPDSRVTLHFSLRLAGDVIPHSEEPLDDGSSTTDDPLLDSTFDRAPAQMVVGDGNLLPGFERCLFGLRAGDRERFRIEPVDGFGHPNPNNIQLVARSSFAADADLTTGMMMSFADASGGEVPGVISGFDGDQVIVDFNHPLAGRELLFEVQILQVDNQSGCDQSSGERSGGDQSGAGQASADQVGGEQGGSAQAGDNQAGRDRSGRDRSGDKQPDDNPTDHGEPES